MFEIPSRIAVIAIALFLVSIPGIVTAQERAAQSAPTQGTHRFDGTALAKTVKILNSTPKLTIEKKGVKQVLEFLSEEFELVFDSAVLESPNLGSQSRKARSATKKSEGAIGLFLVELLGDIRCEYSIRPDGVIAIRRSPRLRTPADPESYKKYAEQIIRNYDSDKDGKLSSEEVKKMRRRPKGADANKDGFLTLDELINYYKPKTSKTSGRTEK